ncbi:type I-C CRISPR-associated protein Cas8c/Csd1 [Spirulina sp.]|uniref:type I-C CRISPR-associated protein Cas8c/Csd1 n=1 Tax=Spirulina sp. TaxID=1157 RepID=UPI003F70DC84
MLLTALANYAQHIDSTPLMYSSSPVRWLIDIDLEGNPPSNLSLSVKEWLGEGKQGKRGKREIVPHVGRTVAVKPKLLADTAEYVLGLPRDPKKADRAADCHAQFKALTRLCAETTQDPAVGAIAQFLDRWNPERDQDQLPDELLKDPSVVVTFRVIRAPGDEDAIPASDHPEFQAVQAFWANYTQNGGEDSNNSQDQGWCLVSGEYRSLEQRLPFLIKGIPGGQPSGTAIVSANSKAFESYGLANSLTSPISRPAAEAFAKALNHLITNDTSSIRVGNTVHVWWTKGNVSGINPKILDKPQNPTSYETIQNLFKAPDRGAASSSKKTKNFFAMALTANNARTVVRSWLNVALEDVKASVKLWFRAQYIVNPAGQDDERYFGLYALSACGYRDAKEMLPRIPTALFFAALTGSRLPMELLATVIRRIRIDRGNITHPRAALIKLYLTLNGVIMPEDTETMIELNLDPNLNEKNGDRTAYHCGRLLAQFEQIQRLAIGRNINTTVLDHYYGSLSTTPRTVIGLLNRKAQNHLSKIRKTKMGAYYNLQTEFEAIYALVNPESPNLPKTFNLEQQSIFAIGYYHQRAHNSKKAQDKAQSKTT